MSNELKYHYLLDYEKPVPYGNISLRQIGIAYCSPNTIFAAHPHDNFFELSIPISGKGTIYTNGIPTLVSENDIYVSFPYESHQIDADKNAPLKYYFFAFVVNNETFKTDLYDLKHIQNDPQNRIIKNKRIKNLIQTILSELSLTHEYTQLYLETLFTQILIELILSLKNKNTNSFVQPTKNEELCYQIMHYVDTHIPLQSLEELTSIFHFDYEYLSHIFKETTKQSLSAYYRAKRLEVARNLIIEGTMTLTEISEKLLYSSLFSFSKSFKQHYGISPSAYIKNP